MNRKLLLIFLLAGLVLALYSNPVRRAMPPKPGTVGAAVTPSPTQVDLAGAHTTEAFESSGVTRIYQLYVPSRYAASRPAPLVINLHGLGASAAAQEALSEMSPKAEAEGFLVAYPEGVNHAWQTGPLSPDVRFLRDLITQVSKAYALDLKRIYITGISNGGGMANRAGCELADVVAAIAPVAGAYEAWKDCRPARPLPVMTVHGLADTTVPYAGLDDGRLAPPIRDWASAWAARNGCFQIPTLAQLSQAVTRETWSGCGQGAEVVLYTIAGQGHSWPGSSALPDLTSQALPATDVIWDFFKAHPLP